MRWTPGWWRDYLDASAVPPIEPEPEPVPLTTVAAEGTGPCLPTAVIPFTVTQARDLLDADIALFGEPA